MSITAVTYIAHDRSIGGIKKDATIRVTPQDAPFWSLMIKANNYDAALPHRIPNSGITIIEIERAS